MASSINEINTALVLRKLWFSKGISRVGIARELGLGKSTVTKIMNVLLRRNLVKSVRGGRSGPSGGRKPLHLMINNRYGYVLGLEIQTEFFKAVAMDLLGEIIFSESQALEVRDKNVAVTFSKVLGRLEKRTRRIDLPLIGVGVGVAGIIDPHKGVIEQSNPLNIRSRFEFYKEITGLLRAPVLIENDAKCCCWGELAFRKTERHRNFIFVLGEFRKGQTTSSNYWGIAVGLGLVLDGKVFRGEDFSAGEFQSILWKDENRGQFSISDEDSRRIKTDRKVMSKVIKELSAHIAFLVNALDLSSVVIGGELSKYEEEIVDVLHSEIQRNWSYPNEVDCSIEFAKLGEMAVAYGAAGMFLESFFSIPEIEDGPARKKPARISVLHGAGR